MKLQLKWLVLPAAVVSLSGCETLYGEDGYIQDRSSDYKGSEVIAPMQLPENYQPLTTPQAMRIPPVKPGQSVASGEFTVPQPEQLVVHTSNSNFNVEQKGSERWIWANQPQEVLWPQLLDFWAFNEVEVASRDPRDGSIETDWVKLYAKGPESTFGKLLTSTGLGDKPSLDRFRIRVAPGTQEGTSQIKLDYINVLEADASKSVDWSKAGDVRVQQAMLNELAVFLDRAKKGDQLVASGQSGLSVDEYASLDRDGNGNPLLRLHLGYPEAWSKVEAALLDAEVKVSDRNRTAGLFFLPSDAEGQVVVEVAESSWGGVFADDAKDENAEPSLYQLRVSALGSEVHVTLEKDINTVAPEAQSEQLLQLIFNNLR